MAEMNTEEGKTCDPIWCDAEDPLFMLYTRLVKVYDKNIYKKQLSFLWIIIFTQPLRSGRIWHKVNF